MLQFIHGTGKIAPDQHLAEIGLEHDTVLSPIGFEREIDERWRAQDRALVRDIETVGIPV